MADTPDPVEAVACALARQRYECVHPLGTLSESQLQDCRNDARAVIDALEEAGYAMVSQEQTEAMVRAGSQAIEENVFACRGCGRPKADIDKNAAAEVFRAMLAVRPGNDRGQPR